MVSKGLNSILAGALCALTSVAVAVPGASQVASQLSRPMQDIVNYAKSHSNSSSVMVAVSSGTSSRYNSKLKDFRIFVDESGLVVSRKGQNGYSMVCDKNKDGMFDVYAKFPGKMSDSEEESVMASLCDTDSIERTFEDERTLGLRDPKMLYKRTGTDAIKYDFSSSAMETVGASTFQKDYMNILTLIRKSIRER